MLINGAPLLEAPWAGSSSKELEERNPCLKLCNLHPEIAQHASKRMEQI